MHRPTFSWRLRNKHVYLSTVPWCAHHKIDPVWEIVNALTDISVLQQSSLVVGIVVGLLATTISSLTWMPEWLVYITAVLWGVSGSLMVVLSLALAATLISTNVVSIVFQHILILDLYLIILCALIFSMSFISYYLVCKSCPCSYRTVLHLSMDHWASQTRLLMVSLCWSSRNSLSM